MNIPQHSAEHTPSISRFGSAQVGTEANYLEYLLGGLLAAKFLKWMPLMISTESRPVVALYTRPTRISGVDAWLTDGNEEALSLQVMSERLTWDSLPYKSVEEKPNKKAVTPKEGKKHNPTSITSEVQFDEW